MNSDQQFEIGSRTFQLNKVNAFKQFHIVRRIAPIMADLLPALKDASKIAKAEMNEEEKFEAFAQIAAPLMNGLSKLTDEDSEYVLYGLLASVQMKQAAGNWAHVANGSMLMIQDMDLPVLLQLAGRAFVYNLAGFFAALPQK